MNAVLGMILYKKGGAPVLVRTPKGYEYMSSSGFPFRDHVKGDGNQKNQPLDGHLQIDSNAHDTHTIIQNTHDQSTDNGTDNCSHTAIGRCSADKAGCDGIQFKACPQQGGELIRDEKLIPATAASTDMLT